MIRAWLLAALLLAANAPALALESAAVTSPRATVTLASETDALNGKPFRLGLHFRLAPGWHIYWRNPGDAGVPPQLDLTLPPGAAATPLAWPAPRRIAEGEVMTFAYTGEVLLPLTVTPAGPGAMAIDAGASWLVCEHLCIPEEGKFHLELPAGAARPSAQAPLFAAADAAMPVPSPYAATIAPDGRLSLSGAGLGARSAAEAAFFPTGDGVLVNDAPQPLAAGQDRLTLALKPGRHFDPKAKLDGVLVLKDRAGLETALAVTAEPGAVPDGPGGGLGRMLLFALAGGLILNLMPCVFPVLAMKAMALARLSGAQRGLVRVHAAFYTAGVLVAFGALGGLLLALRAAGDAVGWGFQFQSPPFVAAMAWLLFALGLNLSGLYTIGASVMGAGQSLADRGGHAGSFFTGMLAVLVATPCTAPFMGAALAAALAAPGPEAIALFLALGLGLAGPYALLAALPGLAGLLPRPGRWMELLKQALAFPMYGAAVWLTWVMSQEAGPSGVLVTLAGLLLLGFAGWALGLAQQSAGAGRRVGHGLALAAMLAAVALLTMIGGAAPTEARPAEAVSDGSEPYSAARLAALRAEGRPVFVDMTAAWCVTCLVNERVALAPEPVRQAFAHHQVAYLKGDWTRQDPAITQFLREHGRDGVPLYLLYPAGPGEPRLLPQILTEGLVLDQLDHLGG